MENGESWVETIGYKQQRKEKLKSVWFEKKNEQKYKGEKENVCKNLIEYSRDIA